MSGPASMDGALPEALPEGETILWQGRPDPASVSRRILHRRALMAYFAALALYMAATSLAGGRTLFATASTLALVAAGALAILGFVWLIGRLVARTTRYTITDRRIVMRIGVALPLTLNVPFRIVEGAGLRAYPEGTGDIPLVIGGNGRIGYLHLFPHARPWHLRRPEPMLRCIPDAGRVAAILAQAVAASSEAASSDTVVASRASFRPSGTGEAAPAAIPTSIAA